jgi:hypothetical protein
MKMGARKKTRTKVNLLELADSERTSLIREAKESLRQKLAEAKLWQSFVETEELTINGELIHFEETDLKGLSYTELMKH